MLIRFIIEIWKEGFFIVLSCGIKTFAEIACHSFSAVGFSKNLTPLSFYLKQMVVPEMQSVLCSGKESVFWTVNVDTFTNWLKVQPLLQCIKMESSMLWKMSWIFTVKAPGLCANPVVIIFSGSFLADTGQFLSAYLCLSVLFYRVFLRPPHPLFKIQLRFPDCKKRGKMREWKNGGET